MMINRILAEFLKIKRQPELRIVLSVFLLFILFIFFQKGMNRQSGFYSPELLNAQYLSSFNLLLICLVGFIPVVVIGSFISGIEYKNNTNVFTITSTGRIYSVLVKIITLIFTILLLVLSMVLLGIIESLLIIPKKNIYIEWSILIPQLLTTFLDLLGSAFLGFLCTVLTKKIYGGIIFAVILPLIIERISFYVPYFQYFTFDYYSLSLVNVSFKNLSKDPQIQLAVLDQFPFGVSLIVCLLIVISIMLIQMMIVMKREFRA